MKKSFIQIGLGVVIIVLGYLVYESIMGPVRFNREKDIREKAVIEKLKDLRISLIAYKSVHGRYTASYDTLIDFLKNGEFPVIMKIGTVPDTLTEVEALKMGIIRRDTAYVNVSDSLFKNVPGFQINSLPIIPYSGGEKFQLQCGEIEKGKVIVHVFEVFAANETFLKGLNKNYFKPEEGLKVGSMTEPITDGNWE